MIVPLEDATAADAAAVGGKGANLGDLTRAGFPVPPGFVITTAAYREAAAACGAGPGLASAPFPPGLAEAAGEAYRRLGSGSVAIRSSATAEDLPGASFAGQQETFLCVRGEAAVLDRVRACWASLWTPRAVRYRRAFGDRAEVAMAVVVQQMAPCEVAGVAFSVDPVRKDPDGLVIEAAPGSGESVVGGTVSPDRWVARRRDCAVLEFTAGSFRRPPPGSAFGTPGRPRGCLTFPQVREVAALTLAVEAHFRDVPQDVEWCRGEGRLFLLQARPITSLDPSR